MDISKAKKRFQIISLAIIVLINIASAKATTLPKAFTEINTNKNTKNLIGKWEMQSVVTDSNCPNIPIGSTTESTLEIISNTNNNSIFKTLWTGGKWKRSIGRIKLLTNKEGVLERFTKTKEDKNTYWSAILIDHIYIDDENVMHSESIIKQYKNNEYIGEYKTLSVLVKKLE